MNSSLHTPSPNPATPAPAKGLRWWLILLTVVAVVVFGLVLLFGWAVNLDTMYDLSPVKDPAVRQDAIEKRIVFWVGITIFGLFLAAGVIGGWRARLRQNNQLAFRLSLLAAVPIVLCIVLFAVAVVLGPHHEHPAERFITSDLDQSITRSPIPQRSNRCPLTSCSRNRPPPNACAPG